MCIALGSWAAGLREKTCEITWKNGSCRKRACGGAQIGRAVSVKCLGYGTYVSNAQERAWRSIKGVFKKGFRYQDVSQLVRETALILQTLVRGGHYWGGPCGAHVFEGFFGLEDEPVKSVKMKVETRSGIPT